jgi:hypothetical protein
MIVTQGGHRLFERGQETARVVSEMLLGSFDGWTPPGSRG